MCDPSGPARDLGHGPDVDRSGPGSRVDVRVPLERSDELKIGLPIVVFNTAGAAAARSSIFFISPRVDDDTQAVLVKGRVPPDSGLRVSQFVRARVVWKTAPGPDHPVAGGGPHQRPAVRVRRRDRRRQACRAPAPRPRSAPIVGNDIVVLGLSARERIVRVGRAEARPTARSSARPDGRAGSAIAGTARMFTQSLHQGPILARRLRRGHRCSRAIAIPLAPIAQYPQLAGHR